MLHRKDFLNLGFDCVEHQRILKKSMKKLVKKYPIPVEDDSDEDSDEDEHEHQIEGLGIQDTGNSN